MSPSVCLLEEGGTEVSPPRAPDVKRKILPSCSYLANIANIFTLPTWRILEKYGCQPTLVWNATGKKDALPSIHFQRNISPLYALKILGNIFLECISRFLLFPVFMT
jgi:hypothetical protein